MGRPSCAFALLLLTLATDVALGHGGTHRGPDGAPIPRGGAATCGPARAPLIGNGTGGASGTPGTTRSTRLEFTHGWEWWWEHNGDLYVDARARMMRNLASVSGYAAPGGPRYDTTTIASLIRSQMRSAIAPILRIGLDDPYFDTRAASVIALGKVLDPAMPEAGEMRHAMRRLLADPEIEVRESACLALGILGDRAEAAEMLLLADDHPKIRAVAGAPGRRVIPRQRAFAALGTGLIGMRNTLDEAVVDELIDTAKNDARVDIRVLATLALGPVQSPAAVPELRRLVTNFETDAIVRAHAIVTLAKLSDQGFSRWLTKVGLEDVSSDVERSSAIALGMLTARNDERTVDALIRRAQWAADRPVRNFCLIALGEIGSPAACKFLLETVEKGPQLHDRTFAALAMGVCGMKWKDRKDELGETLLWRWKDVKDEYERGAFAIGLGLLDYQPAVPALLDALKSAKFFQLKGHAATALGLLGAREAGPFLRALALDATDPATQARARRALGLLDDPEAVALLLEAIRSPVMDLSALGAAAVGLGYTGRRDAVPLLGALLTKGDALAPDTRAFAAVALGRLGDKDDVPALTSARAPCNYLATTETLRELFRIY